MWELRQPPAGTKNHTQINSYKSGELSREHVRSTTHIDSTKAKIVHDAEHEEKHWVLKPNAPPPPQCADTSPTRKTTNRRTFATDDAEANCTFEPDMRRNNDMYSFAGFYDRVSHYQARRQLSQQKIREYVEQEEGLPQTKPEYSEAVQRVSPEDLDKSFYRLHTSNTISAARRKERQSHLTIQEQEDTKECTFQPNMNKSRVSMENVRKVEKEREQRDQYVFRAVFGTHFEEVDCEELVEGIIKNGREAYRNVNAGDSAAGGASNERNNLNINKNIASSAKETLRQRANNFKRTKNDKINAFSGFSANYRAKVSNLPVYMLPKSGLTKKLIEKFPNEDDQECKFVPEINNPERHMKCAKKYLSQNVFDRLAFTKPRKGASSSFPNASAIDFEKPGFSPKVVPKTRSFIPGKFNNGNFNNGVALPSDPLKGVDNFAFGGAFSGDDWYNNQDTEMRRSRSENRFNSHNTTKETGKTVLTLEERVQRFLWFQDVCNERSNTLHADLNSKYYPKHKHAHSNGTKKIIEKLSDSERYVRPEHRHKKDYLDKKEKQRVEDAEKRLAKAAALPRDHEGAFNYADDVKANRVWGLEDKVGNSTWGYGGHLEGQKALAECTFQPHISERARSLPPRSNQDRFLDAVRMDRRKEERQHKHAVKMSNVYTYAPYITERAKALEPSLIVTGSIEEYVNAIRKWREKKLRMEKKAEEKRIKEEMRECTFQPAPRARPPKSVRKIAHTWNLYKKLKDQKEQDVK